MTIFESLILGIVQGLTEFLPISSSAHLRIVGLLFPHPHDPGAAFTAITQLGTELAVLVYFSRDIFRIFSKWIRSLSGKVSRNDPDVRMMWLIIVGSVPIFVLGFLFRKMIETNFRSLWIVSVMLIFFGILLGIADYVGSKSKKLEKLTFGHGIIFGLAQALALIPGVSRSGGTITAGLLLGYDRQSSARYSFLLAIPAVLGSGGYQLLKSFGEKNFYTPFETFLATAVAFAVGLFVISVLMKYLSKGSFLPFVVYRVLLGITLLILLSVGIIAA